MEVDYRNESVSALGKMSMVVVAMAQEFRFDGALCPLASVRTLFGESVGVSLWVIDNVCFNQLCDTVTPDASGVKVIGMAILASEK